MTTTTKDPKLTKALNVIKKLQAEIEVLKARPVRDRGPLSQRTMTEDDARKILLGDMRDVSHRTCAEKLGLSYGQVYSSRNGFTFKGVYKEHRDAVAKAAIQATKRATKKAAPKAKPVAQPVTEPVTA